MVVMKIGRLRQSEWQRIMRTESCAWLALSPALCAILGSGYCRGRYDPGRSREMNPSQGLAEESADDDGVVTQV